MKVKLEKNRTIRNAYTVMYDNRILSVLVTLSTRTCELDYTATYGCGDVDEYELAFAEPGEEEVRGVLKLVPETGLEKSALTWPRYVSVCKDQHEFVFIKPSLLGVKE